MKETLEGAYPEEDINCCYVLLTEALLDFDQCVFEMYI